MTDCVCMSLVILWCCCLLHAALCATMTTYTHQKNCVWCGGVDEYSQGMEKQTWLAMQAPAMRLESVPYLNAPKPLTATPPPFSPELLMTANCGTAGGVDTKKRISPAMSGTATARRLGGRWPLICQLHLSGSWLNFCVFGKADWKTMFTSVPWLKGQFTLKQSTLCFHNEIVWEKSEHH